MMKLVNIQEVADMLAVEPKTVYGWVSLDKIPHYKLSKAVRFSPDEVSAWAKTCQRGPKLCDNTDTQTVAGQQGGKN